MSLAVLAGIGIGTGLMLLWAGFAPAREPLDAALARLGQPLPADNRAQAGPAMSFEARLGARLRRWAPVERLVEHVRADLHLLGRNPDEQVAEIATYGLVGLLWAPVVAAGAVFLGFGVPVVIPVWLALGGAAAAVVVSVRHIRQQAAAARATFAHVVSAYCDVLAIMLSAGYELHAATFEAAARGSGRAFRQLQNVLAEGFLLGERPWESMANLGRQLAVQDLVELGATLAIADTEGAAVADTLMVKAASMRERLTSTTERQAAGATERMAIPGAMVLIGFLWLLAYPALSLIFQEAGA